MKNSIVATCYWMSAQDLYERVLNQSQGLSTAVAHSLLPSSQSHGGQSKYKLALQNQANHPSKDATINPQRQIWICLHPAAVVGNDRLLHLRPEGRRVERPVRAQNIRWPICSCWNCLYNFFWAYASWMYLRKLLVIMMQSQSASRCTRHVCTALLRHLFELSELLTVPQHAQGRLRSRGFCCKFFQQVHLCLCVFVQVRILSHIWGSHNCKC